MGSWTLTWTSGTSRSCSCHPRGCWKTDTECRMLGSRVMELWCFPRGCAGHQESRQTHNLWVTREGPLGPKVKLPNLFCCPLDMEGRKLQDRGSGIGFYQLCLKQGKYYSRQEERQGVIRAADKPHLQMRKTEAQRSSAQFKGAALVRGRAESGTGVF